MHQHADRKDTQNACQKVGPIQGQSVAPHRGTWCSLSRGVTVAMQWATRVAPDLQCCAHCGSGVKGNRRETDWLIFS